MDGGVQNAIHFKSTIISLVLLVSARRKTTFSSMHCLALLAVSALDSSACGSGS